MWSVQLRMREEGLSVLEIFVQLLLE